MRAIRRTSTGCRNRRSNLSSAISAMRRCWNALCPAATPSCISRRNHITTIPSSTRNRSSARTWRARCGCWRPRVNTTCDSTTSAPTKCTETWRWTIRRDSTKTRRTARQARTARRKPRPTIWCARGRAHTACAPPFPTVPTITGHISMWKIHSTPDHIHHGGRAAEAIWHGRERA